MTALQQRLRARDRRMPDQTRFSPLVTWTPDSSLVFDSYISCRTNEFVIDLAYAVAVGPRKTPYSPLYIYAEVGIGKTHLLSAIANFLGPSRAVLINAVDFAVEAERAWSQRKRAALRAWFSRFDAILIDDIQLANGDLLFSEELFSVLSRALPSRQGVVISSDVPPTRLDRVEERLVSRIGGGVIAHLQMCDVPAREEIVRRVLQDCPADNGIVRFLAEHGSTNIRGIKAAAEHLKAVHEHTGRTIDLELARATVDARRSGVSVAVEPAVTSTASSPEFFKAMLADATTEDEQILALQIAVNERLRQLRQRSEETPQRYQLERALEHLRDGNLKQALHCMNA